MGNAVTERIAALAKSEKGASFSVALLLVLVCVALSSAVIAAATASSGRFAEQGKMDARYYAVTSAAGLFRDSLGEDETAKYVFTQQYTPGEGESGGTVELVSPTGVVNADGSAKGFEFLPEVTYYALYGGVPASDAEGAWVISSSASGLIEPFESGGFSGAASAHTFIVTPAGSWANKPAGVQVDAVLKNNWTLELDFHNTDAKDSSNNTNEAQTFHVHMVLAANVDNDASSAGGVEKRQTTVTWALQRIVQGEGNS